MNISRPFVLRPVATILIMVAILLAGAVAYKQLPVSALPQVDYPTILVQTFYPGASPDDTAKLITAPLERQFGQVPGLNQMTSTSSEGCSVITLQFNLDLNIDVAEQQVQASINAATTYLPKDLPNPPIYSKSNPADTPILTLALSSKTLPLSKVQDLADTRLAQKISQLPGVGLVTLSGGQKPAVRIQANPTALAALGLNLDDLRTTIAAANVNQAKGSFDGPRQAFTIAANDQLLSSDQYKDLIIRYASSGTIATQIKDAKPAPVKLTDVADVIDGTENFRQAAWVGHAGKDGQPSEQKQAIIVNIQRQPGANIIEVVDRVKALLPQLQNALPKAIAVEMLTDRTTTIRASVADVQMELGFTVALVVAVIFVFLRSFAATFIPGAAVPLSIVGTFGFMYLLGYSLNNLTLMALTISTGFVVDDAIVMVENISRLIEDGKSPLEAALEGSAQIGFTILSLSVSLIAVLIPLLFMGDIVGRLFREFAVTLSLTIVMSAFVSLTLTPMMAAKVLRHRPDHQHGWFYRVSERGFQAMIDFYERTLRVVMRHRVITMFVFLATLAATIYLYVAVPKGFFPVQDTGVILGISEANQDIAFPALASRQQRLADVVLQDPAVESLSSFIGVDGTNTTPNSGRIQINLKPIEERKQSASEVIRRLQTQLSTVAGISLYMQPVQDLTVEDRLARTQYQYTLEGPDAKELAVWVPQFLQRLQALPQLTDVASDQQNHGLQLMLTIDRDSCTRLGITQQNVNDALYNAYGQRQISTMFTQLNQSHVVLEVKQAFRDNPADLSDIYLRSSAGTQVPLNQIARVTETSTPLSVNRQGQFPVVTISFNLAPGASLGEAVDQITRVKTELGVPASIAGEFQGSARAFRASLSNEVLLIAFALIVVYIVLGVLYESFIHPITILSTLPSAGVGAIIALMVCHEELGVIGLIGIILLIGIVKKNAIMMIDFALEAERGEGKEPEDAIFQACLLRFRPIMMTTMAALLGAVPLAIGGGVGTELRRPLGITIIGGLIFSQVLTLYTTPVIYLAFDKISRRLFGKWKPIEDEEEGGKRSERAEPGEAPFLNPGGAA